MPAVALLPTTVQLVVSDETATVPDTLTTDEVNVRSMLTPSMPSATSTVTGTDTVAPVPICVLAGTLTFAAPADDAIAARSAQTATPTSRDRPRSAGELVVR